jgi:hypothetical protein
VWGAWGRVPTLKPSASTIEQQAPPRDCLTSVGRMGQSAHAQAFCFRNIAHGSRQHLSLKSIYENIVDRLIVHFLVFVSQFFSVVIIYFL